MALCKACDCPTIITQIGGFRFIVDSESSNENRRRTLEINLTSCPFDELVFDIILFYWDRLCSLNP